VKGNLIWMETSLPAHSYWMIERIPFFWMFLRVGPYGWGVGLGFVP